MNGAKVKDVRDLYKFIDQESIVSIENLFEERVVEEISRGTVEEMSEEESDND